MDENYLSALNTINRTQPTPAASKAVQSSGANTAGSANFQQLLVGMLLSGLSSSSTDASSTDSLLGTSADSLMGTSTDSLLSGTSSTSSSSMSSMMLNMIEQLLASQVSKLQTTTNASAPTGIIDEAKQSGGGVPYSVLAGATAPSPTVQTGGNDTPQGRPVGGVLTQGFHSTHHALDFGVVIGTPVHATMDGKVVYAGWNNEGYGNLVIVQNGAYKTYFAHLSSIPVTLNQSVKAGSVVGLSGSTGNSTGPHVHYEVRKNNVAIDPTSFTLAK